MSEENWNDNENNSFSGSLDPTSVHSQQEMGRDANPGFGQDISEPEPMPSTDNMYRFQNVNVHSENQNKKKPKNSGGIKKAVISAVVFGGVAAVCFFGLMMVTGVRFSKNSSGGGSIGSVDTTPVSEVTAVSGTAVGFGDVSAIVDKVMPSIVAITETSTVSSYFGQTYSTEGAGSGFIVKEDNDELLIVTNNHVVENADSITVTFIDETTAKGTVKGTDSTADLAVIAVKISELKDDTKQKIKVSTLDTRMK